MWNHRKPNWTWTILKIKLCPKPGQLRKRMTKRKFERLKDILIDHVYDYCYNEIVQKMEGDGNSITYDSPSLLNEEPTARFVDQLKNAKHFRAYYTTRDTDFCQIITPPDFISPKLSNRFDQSKIRRGTNIIKKVDKAQSYLVARSYFSINNPHPDRIKLTEKGLRHYLDGASFEIEYLNRRNSNIAIVVSFISILIALTAILI